MFKRALRLVRWGFVLGVPVMLGGCFEADHCVADSCKPDDESCRGAVCGDRGEGDVAPPDWETRGPDRPDDDGAMPEQGPDDAGVGADPEVGADGPGELADSDWVVVVDERFHVGQRGVSPDPGPSLAVDADGRPHVAFTYRSGPGWSMSYAERRADGEWTEEREIGPSSYAVNLMLSDAAVRLVAPGQDWTTTIYERGTSWTEQARFDTTVSQAFVTDDGWGRLVAFNSDRQLLVASESTEGWETELLHDPAGDYPTLGAGGNGSGTVGALVVDTHWGAYRFVDTTGRHDVLEEVALPMPYVVPRVAYATDGSAWVALTVSDRDLVEGDEARLYHLEGGQWSYEVLALDRDPPSNVACPENPDSECTFETEAHRVLALVAAGEAVLPLVERSALEARYDRECLEWDFPNYDCVAVCMDEGGPRGPWSQYAYEVPVGSPTLVVGGTPVALDPPLHDRRELSAAMDDRGRMHIAYYAPVSDDWTDGNDVRYLRLER